MANEKSRNHQPRGGDKGGNAQAQGKPDSDKQSKAGPKLPAGGKPGPGKQPRDQLTIRKGASTPGHAD